MTENPPHSETVPPDADHIAVLEDTITVLCQQREANANAVTNLSAQLLSMDRRYAQQTQTIETLTKKVNTQKESIEKLLVIIEDLCDKEDKQRLSRRVVAWVKHQFQKYHSK